MPIGYLSTDTTVLSNLSLTGEVAASNVSVAGGPRFSGVTADFRTLGVIQSWATRADESGITIGQLGLLFQASGVSLILSSGKSYYIIGQSAVSGAHA